MRTIGRSNVAAFAELLVAVATPALPPRSGRQRGRFEEPKTPNAKTSASLTMHVIAVDIGNSSTKFAVGDAHSSNTQTSITTVSNDELIEIDVPGSPALWSVSSVNVPRLRELECRVAYDYPEHRVVAITADLIPLETQLDSREGTGIDRLVAAWMAKQINGGKGPAIVIDAGTAVTIDVIDADGVFQGGVIFPGAAAALASLCASADALPDLSGREYLPLAGDLRQDIIGKSTHPAIVRGVMQSQIGGILHVVKCCKQLDQIGAGAAVYATGGGIPDLQDALPEDWHYITDLVLQGARAIGELELARS